MRFIPRLLKKNVNVTPSSLLGEFFILLGGLICIVIGIYIVLGFAVDWLVPRISPETERKIVGYFPEAKSDDGPSGKDQIVQTLLDTIQNQCVKLPYKLTVRISDNPGVNAVALRGGQIVIFSGLLNQLESENELAFVLAHEIGHFVNRDHLRESGRALVLMTISALLFGTDSSLGEFMAEWVGITEMRFSRTQETRADEYALNVLNCFYGHVNGSTLFFEKMGKEERSKFIGHYFSSHPEFKKRIAHLNEYAREKRFSEGTLRALPAGLKREE